MAISVVSFSFSRAAQLEAQGPSSLLDDGSKTPSGVPRAPSAGCGFSLPHLVSNSVRSLTVPSCLDRVIYYSWTPTQSLEWHVWLSLSGNNSHVVQRSLSSGASVYECIMAFTLSHFISQIHPRDLFRLLAIGMYHFLPVRHFGMACLTGPKVKIYHSTTASKQLWNLLQAFPIVSLFKLVNAARILAFSLSLLFLRVCCPLTQLCPT